MLPAAGRAGAASHGGTRAPARRLAVYGLALETALALPGLDLVAGRGRPTRLELAEPDLVRARFSGSLGAPVTLSTADGPVRVRRGAEGDVELECSGVMLCHVAADGGSVLCAADDPESPGFLRLVLDTVLGTTALRRGQEGLHAAGVLVEGRLVAISAPSGAGKSTLAAALMQSGATLFSDDLLLLTPGAGRPIAHAGPAVMNLPAGVAAQTEVRRRLALIDGEAWVELERRPPEPQPVALAVILDRRPGAGPPCLHSEPSPAALLGFALDSGTTPERRRDRLDLLAALARSTPVLRLRAGREVAPRQLAACVLDGLRSAAPCPG